MADLDSDGDDDLISGSWPGEIFLFRGGPGRTFAPPEMLRDWDDEIIAIGGGVEERDGEILVTGHGEFETIDGKSVVRYHGEILENRDDKPMAITGTASAVFAADWDDDGDHDLIAGFIGGDVHYLENAGTAKEWAFADAVALEAGGEPIRVEGDAGPHVADWDGDGDLDLLVGAGSGAVSWFENVGSRKQPKLAAAVGLVSAGRAEFGENAPREPVRGIRAKVCTADWNGDGRLDLLLGDFATQRPARPDPTPEEQAKHDELRAEIERLEPEYQKAVQRFFDSRERKESAETRAKLQAEYSELSQKMQSLREQLPPDYENHGWVWLFLRAPIAQAAQD